MSAMRFFTIAFSLSTLSLILGCDNGDKGGDDNPDTEDTNTPDDNDDTGDTSDNEIDMTVALEVHARHMDANYLGYDVIALGNGWFCTGDLSENQTVCWQVSSTDSEDVDYPTDSADMTIQGLDTSFGGIGHAALFDENGDLTYFMQEGDYYADHGYGQGGVALGFTGSTIAGGTTIASEDASVTITGNVDDMYLGNSILADLDGDGFEDWFGGGGDPGIGYVVSDIMNQNDSDTGDTGGASSPTLEMPNDESFSFDICGGESTAGTFCASSAEIIEGHLVVIDSYNTSGGIGLIEAYELPLSESSTPTWDFSGSGSAVPLGTNRVWVDSMDVLVMNFPGNDEFIAYDANGSETGDRISMPDGGEAWGIAHTTYEGEEYMAFGSPLRENGEGYTGGGVYVCNVTYGLPNSHEDCEFKYEGFKYLKVGWSVDFGLMEDGALGLAVGYLYTSSTSNTSTIGMLVLNVTGGSGSTDTGTSSMTANKPTIIRPEDKVIETQILTMDSPKVQELLSRGLHPGVVEIR